MSGAVTRAGGASHPTFFQTHTYDRAGTLKRSTNRRGKNTISRTRRISRRRKPLEAVSIFQVSPSNGAVPKDGAKERGNTLG